ncbi:MAG: polysaccharide deacetylase family protein [Polynucleobacter victoriensis]
MKKLVVSLLVLASFNLQAAACNQPIYLTFDTGNMDVAEYVAKVLRQHQVKATFFLANEKTKRGDYSLDDSWASYWQALKKDGHAFGNHTYFHTYLVKDLDQSTVIVKSQFGHEANKARKMSQDGLCADMGLVKQRFEKLTGTPLDPIWRAPGGKVSAQYIQMGEVCGYRHVGWSKSGFLGDELSSEKFSNQQLLKKALTELKPGDIAMAHLGIWSRKDPWATAVLEPLIVGLKKKGYCFDTILSLQQHSEISRIIKP